MGLQALILSGAENDQYIQKDFDLARLYVWRLLYSTPLVPEDVSQNRIGYVRVDGTLASVFDVGASTTVPGEARVTGTELS
jgi:hypothetical protein